ncbi:MAG: amidohydrolase [Rhodospirillaceae bacterium]|jgi:predicted TIM-barrel fold metal-dependent hydrolase|nr:amidohydrolase [Rhodospirillaceae bacterium]MBT4719123.1 amidohydrolase [Rhodospirillaceae bacterium]MBT4748805.1 amidohydrolase [Rhodospirillaceae bacterium]MBT5179411.1 amidohydrolase [Rhodospirillaceae bacterium]MBT5841314.1 amidohydrolase [Rhodospirillaceae bacterium]
MADTSTNGHGFGRIDVHHHIAPPEYIRSLSPDARMPPPLAGWTPERSIETMDEGGVDFSLTSITLPGLWFGDVAEARRMARLCNDYAAQLRADHPNRFGMFVNLPLPDIDGSLAEIEYGMDQLGADGIVLFTSYGDVWLGDPAYDTVYAELNRRKCIVYVHPMTPECCENILPGIPDAVVEYQTDTSRAIARVVFGGMAAKFPDIRFIWSHGGGTMPFLIHRYEKLGALPQSAEAVPDGFMAAARKFYYDTAQVAEQAAMLALRAVASSDNIVFGTDFPFLSADHHTRGLAACGVFNEQELRAIDSGNILKWLPQYAD